LPKLQSKTGSARGCARRASSRLTLAHVERLADALEVSTDPLLAAQPSPDPARDGRTWWPVGAERPEGPRI